MHVHFRAAIVRASDRTEAKGTSITTIEVFDPAMCCSPAAYGPRVDLDLARFEADLGWLAAQGANVTRYSLSVDPHEFLTRPIVAALLNSCGEDLLPIVLVDGRFCFGGLWPSHADLIGSCDTSEVRSTL